ncbi:cobaltochelatase CobT-related protein [Azohydromonas aeria]|uniref:cobaltochelatase CobT-related protein n=1 Tax=Azohydromonas aeria TaxID=2590212 RepID=UPI0012F9C762|nr:cobalt chelatase [Azohydromonas aeria]
MDLRLQHEQRLAAAALRALSGRPRLQWRAGRLLDGDAALRLDAPHLRLQAEERLHALRGCGDALALRLCHSQAALHEHGAPAGAIERLVFDLLEQLRCESRVPAHLPGVCANVRGRFADWSRSALDAGLAESASGLLLFTLAQLCWSRFNARALPDESEGLIEATRAGIAPAIGPWLSRMQRSLDDQAAFAEAALALARWTGQRLREAAAAQGRAPQATPANRAGAALSWLLPPGECDTALLAPEAAGSRLLEAASGGYRVFTRAHDRELRAATLVRPALLREYRERIDAQLARLQLHHGRLARQLQRVLAQPAVQGWDFGQEHGHIDGRRLAQLACSPAERRLFTQEAQQPRTDAAVTILVDCSSSMRSHAEGVAQLADVLLRALEAAGATTELLGYTTSGWNGGRARAAWLAAGRPAHPGRLNERCHLVFKDAGRSWRRARLDVAALLKADLFREGIDGEAVEWACARLRARPQARRILLVVSDGSPMDSATAQANDTGYLDAHLQQVVSREERAGIALLGVGVGLDLGAWYRHSVAAELRHGLTQELPQRVVAAIARSLARHP